MSTLESIAHDVIVTIGASDQVINIFVSPTHPIRQLTLKATSGEQVVFTNDQLLEFIRQHHSSAAGGRWLKGDKK